MIDPCPQAAVQATAQALVAGSAQIVALGFEPIPEDEVIAESDPAEYVAPGWLWKTAPDLAPAFGELLGRLRDLNARFAGRRTVEVQATLSLNGEHEWLEEEFLDWCRAYFAIRGSLGRLNPRNGNDPWRLYLACCGEFERLLGWRIVQPGTINLCVLNLSQRFMETAFATLVLGPDLRGFTETNRDRYSDEASRRHAFRLVAGYARAVEAFTKFLRGTAEHLPANYAPLDGPCWLADIQAKVARRAEDLAFLRYVLCVLGGAVAEPQQLAPDLWAQFDWDVHHGGSIGAVSTSFTPEPSAAGTTRHSLAFRRDGWLCHREYPWVRIDPDDLPEARRSRIAVSWYVLDLLTAPLYEAWGRLDPGPVVARGLEPGATEEQQTVALVVALAEPDAAGSSGAARKRPGLPRLRLKRIRTILSTHFDCEWSMAKGSEQKVYRRGGKLFVFGCHGADRQVSPVMVKNCLDRLGISCVDFIAACG